MTREQQLRKYTMNIYLSLTLTLLISVLLSIVILRSRQVVIEEPRVATFSYTNIEEIEDIKPTQKPESKYEVIFNDDEVDALARCVWGEARGCNKTQQSAVVWCVLNRADNWNMSIIEVLEQHGQFVGYKDGHPITDEIRTLVIDVLTRWQIEAQGATEREVMRTLPSNYMWFNANADYTENIFKDEWQIGNVWTWSLPNPYGD